MNLDDQIRTLWKQIAHNLVQEVIEAREALLNNLSSKEQEVSDAKPTQG